MLKKNMLIKGGELLDIKSGYRYDRKDILIENGIIKEIQNDINSDGYQVLNLNGQIVLPGFIDIHTHVYFGKTSLGIDPDIIGIHTGTTTVFDAGSSGADNFDDFYKNVISKSQTRVFSLINIARTGLKKDRYELADLNNLDIGALKDTVDRNRDYIKGIKARASKSAVGEMGIKPIEIAKKAASLVGLPLVVHIGHYPPHVEDVLNLLDRGDVITHCFHGKSNGLMNADGSIKYEAINAKKRGVLFDIGHGTESFNFNTAKRAIGNGFYPDIISTDIYLENYKGPVHSLAITMTKIMESGIGLEECVSKVTSVPADNFKLDKLGMLKEGYIGDLTIIHLDPKPIELVDSDKNVIHANKQIIVDYVVKDGQVTKLTAR